MLWNSIKPMHQHFEMVTNIKNKWCVRQNYLQNNYIEVITSSNLLSISHLSYTKYEGSFTEIKVDSYTENIFLLFKMQIKY